MRCMWADIEGLYGGGDAAGGPWCRSGPVRGGLWAWGVGFERWWDGVRCASAAAHFAMKVVAMTSVTVGGSEWLGLNVIEDVPGGPGSRCRPGAGLGLGLEFGCGLRPRRADGLERLLSGRLGLQPGCGGVRPRGVGLGGGGFARGGDGFWGPVGEVFSPVSGVECWMRTWWLWWMRWLSWSRLWSRRRMRGLSGTAEGPGLPGRA